MGHLVFWMGVLSVIIVQRLSYCNRSIVIHSHAYPITSILQTPINIHTYPTSPQPPLRISDDITIHRSRNCIAHPLHHHRLNTPLRKRHNQTLSQYGTMTITSNIEQHLRHSSQSNTSEHMGELQSTTCFAHTPLHDSIDKLHQSQPHHCRNHNNKPRHLPQKHSIQPCNHSFEFTHIRPSNTLISNTLKPPVKESPMRGIAPI